MLLASNISSNTPPMSSLLALYNCIVSMIKYIATYGNDYLPIQAVDCTSHTLFPLMASCIFFCHLINLP